MRSLRLFVFLLGHSRGLVIAMVGAGALSGLFSAGVLALISRALLQFESANAWLALAFVALVLGKLVSSMVATFLLVRFSQGTILDLSLTLCKKLLHAPLRTLEQRGAGRILATLTDDVSSVTWALQSLPQLASSVAVVLGCGLYLAWLSPVLFAAAAVVTLAGVAVYAVLHKRAFVIINTARDARTRLFELFRELTDGVKELMMHRARRTQFVSDELAGAAEKFRRSNLAATTHYAFAEAWVQGLYHVLIGLMLFLLPLYAKPSPEALSGYVFALLYMMGPIWSIINTVPVVARGQIALQRIEELDLQLGSRTAAVATPSEDALHASVDAIAPAPVLAMREVRYAYEASVDGEGETKAFAIGPIDFTLRAGELVFLVGGNGSGKTTFMKVLAGLYAPSAGEIRLSGTPVTDSNREWYREHFSTIFADFHLFQRLYGVAPADIEGSARQYLQMLGIDTRVSITGNEYSTIALSQGQRKRLALVTAYLEDRPFYVFDEWAADQDPEYKEIFYHRLLPDLARRGKAVLVISHDDRYFHLGQRVVKLEDGRFAC